MSNGWEALVKTIKYKPNTTLEVVNEIGTTSLVITMLVEDVNHPGRMTTVVRRESLPDFSIYNRDTSIRVVRRIIQGLELHETDEWFTVDGVRVFDPHASEGARL